MINFLKKIKDWSFLDEAKSVIKITAFSKNDSGEITNIYKYDVYFEIYNGKTLIHIAGPISYYLESVQDFLKEEKRDLCIDACGLNHNGVSTYISNKCFKQIIKFAQEFDNQHFIAKEYQKTRNKAAEKIVTEVLSKRVRDE